MKYQSNHGAVTFSQSLMPRMLFVIFGQLGVQIEFTGSKLMPYQVRMSESEFLSCVDMAEEI